MIAKFLDMNHEEVFELGDFTVIKTNDIGVELSEEDYYDTSIEDLYNSIKIKYNAESLISVLDYGDEIVAIITIDNLDYDYTIYKH